MPAQAWLLAGSPWPRADSPSVLRLAPFGCHFTEHAELHSSHGSDVGHQAAEASGSQASVRSSHLGGLKSSLLVPSVPKAPKFLPHESHIG